MTTSRWHTPQRHCCKLNRVCLANTLQLCRQPIVPVAAYVKKHRNVEVGADPETELTRLTRRRFYVIYRSVLDGCEAAVEEQLRESDLGVRWALMVTVGLENGLRAPRDSKRITHQPCRQRDAQVTGVGIGKRTADLVWFGPADIGLANRCNIERKE